MQASLWVLAAALESEYIGFSDLVAWADRKVDRLESPPSWLIDLCLAGTKEDARTLLLVTRDRQLESAGTSRPDDERHDDLYLGFLYLRFERGDLSMAELLTLAGRYSDCSRCEIPCEVFYLMLNETDGRSPTIPSDRPLPERVAEVFAPMAGSARQYRDLLIMQGH